jgi:hypothetical protein
VRALRRRLGCWLGDEPTRLATMLRQVGIRIDVEDGQVVAVDLRLLVLT